MQTRLPEFPVNSIRICIDREREEICGRISAIALEKEIAFFSRKDLVIKINQIFDKIGQPQAHQILRSFRNTGTEDTGYCGAPVRYHTSEAIYNSYGKARTLDMMMVSRHNSEWQGVVKDKDGNVICNYSSTLDFIKWL